MNTRLTTALLAALLLTGATAASAAAAGGGQDGACGHHRAADPVLSPYLAIQAALAGDTLDGVAAAAEDLAAGAGEAGLADVSAAARAVGAAGDLEAAREAFAPLSDALVAARGDGMDGGARVAYCPMAGHSWLQAGDAIANPYYGASMLRCGTFVSN